MSRHWIITRRDFVRGALGAAAAATATDAGAALGSVVTSANGRQGGSRPARSARVVLTRDQQALNQAHEVNTVVLDRMLADTVTRVTGQRTAVAAWQALVKPSETVGLVATNHLNPTHAELVAAVRRALVGAGVPAAQIVDAQGGIDRPRGCTALIAMPGLKAHWLTGIGTTLKLYIMFSGRPRDYHYDAAANLAETWLLPEVKGKTRLVLVDALRPLCDKGPQPDPRYMWDYCGLLGSTDPVAADTISLQIIMAKRKALSGGRDWPLSPPPICVAAADEKFGLGTSRLSEISLEKIGWTTDSLV